MKPLLRRAALGAIVICVALGISACAPPAPTPPTPAPPVSLPGIPVSPSATPEPDPEPVAEPGSRPEPAADIVCDDLTNPAELDPLFTVAVDLAPPTRTFEYVGAAIARPWIVRQAGGVACQWSDPNGMSTSEGRYLAGMDLRLLPASGPQWQEFSDTYGDGSDYVFVCDEYGCQYDRYTSTGWWLSLDAFDIDTLASPTPASVRSLARPIFRAIVATVEALPAPDPGWTAPVADFTFGGGCSGVITSARLASVLGGSGSFDHENIGWPELDSVGGSRCRWTRPSDFTLSIDITVLPGGAWAQEAAKAAMLENGGEVPSPSVTGVPHGSTALYEHVDSLSLDIVLGGTWVKISIASGAPIAGMTTKEALKAIAADIAAHAH